MKNKEKARLVASLFLAMFYSIMWAIYCEHPQAAVWYGWFFGVIGVVRFTLVTWAYIRGIAGPDREEARGK